MNIRFTRVVARPYRAFDLARVRAQIFDVLHGIPCLCEIAG